jgi:hypothetical protein
MKCNLGDERTIVLTYCGRKVLKNSEIIYVDEKDLTQPEISYLIRKSILVVVSDEDEDEIKVQTAAHPETECFKCTLPKGRRMAIDSIKGTVEGGKKIEIKKSCTYNQDVDYCIRTGILVRVGEESEENIIEEVKIKVEKPDSEEEAKEEAVKDIKIDEITVSGEKKEQPKFRVEDSAADVFKRIAKEIYKNQKTSAKKTKKPTKAKAK